MKLLPRVALTAATLALAACQGIRDAFSAHPRVAASAAGQDLTVERLAGWVSGIKRGQPTAKNLAGLAGVYVDYMVFAVQLAKGRNMEDSLLVLHASWPTVAELRWNRFHDQLFAGRTRLSAGQVDSAYQAGNVRLFQHILIQVPASATPQDVEHKRTETEKLLRQTSSQHGSNFSALARRYSEDPGSKGAGGYLPAAAGSGARWPERGRALAVRVPCDPPAAVGRSARLVHRRRRAVRAGAPRLGLRG
jgi:hypothetical protein